MPSLELQRPIEATNWLTGEPCKAARPDVLKVDGVFIGTVGREKGAAIHLNQAISESAIAACVRIANERDGLVNYNRIVVMPPPPLKRCLEILYNS